MRARSLGQQRLPLSTSPGNKEGAGESQQGWSQQGRPPSSQPPGCPSSLPLPSSCQHGDSQSEPSWAAPLDWPLRPGVPRRERGSPLVGTLGPGPSQRWLQAQKVSSRVRGCGEQTAGGALPVAVRQLGAPGPSGGSGGVRRPLG
ncbi:uncharacterized protein LOC144376207 [Ictidomys tridecemlineatus]